MGFHTLGEKSKRSTNVTTESYDFSSQLFTTLNWVVFKFLVFTEIIQLLFLKVDASSFSLKSATI